MVDADREQIIRDIQREYLDFLDDNVSFSTLDKLLGVCLNL